MSKERIDYGIDALWNNLRKDLEKSINLMNKNECSMEMQMDVMLHYLANMIDIVVHSTGVSYEEVTKDFAKILYDKYEKIRECTCHNISN